MLVRVCTLPRLAPGSVERALLIAALDVATLEPEADVNRAATMADRARTANPRLIGWADAVTANIAAAERRPAHATDEIHLDDLTRRTLYQYAALLDDASPLLARVARILDRGASRSLSVSLAAEYVSRFDAAAGFDIRVGEPDPGADTGAADHPDRDTGVWVPWADLERFVPGCAAPLLTAAAAIRDAIPAHLRTRSRPTDD